MKDLFSIVQEAAVLNGCLEDARYALFEQHVSKTIAAAISLHKRLPDGILFDEQDFVMIGLQALWETSERYESSTGCSFWTYAYPRITGSMIDEIRGSDPVSRSNRDTLKRIERKKQELEQESGREATFEKACSILGIDSEKRSELQEIASIHFISMDRSSLGSGGREAKTSIEEAIADPNSIDPTSFGDREDEVAGLERLLDRLEPVERSLIRLYFFSGLRLSDVALALDLTESRMSQRLNQVLEKLRRFAKGSGFSAGQIKWE